MSSIKVLMTHARTLRDEKEVLNRNLKEINKAQAAVDAQILEYLLENDMDKCTVDGNTAVAAKKTVANVTDWDAFFGYVASKKAFHMLQRRCSSNAVVETINAVEPIPGAEVVELRDLGFRRD